jgi:hypothetical protein
MKLTTRELPEFTQLGRTKSSKLRSVHGREIGLPGRLQARAGGRLGRAAGSLGLLGRAAGSLGLLGRAAGSLGLLGRAAGSLGLLGRAAGSLGLLGRAAGSLGRSGSLGRAVAVVTGLDSGEVRHPAASTGHHFPSAGTTYPPGTT